MSYRRFQKVGPPVTTGAESTGASMTSGNTPFAWIIASLAVATLAVLILTSAVIGTTGNDTNSRLRDMQNKVTPPVNASCDAKAEERRTQAYQLRVNAAFNQYAKRVECHLRNNDEIDYSGQNFYASYSKFLPHDALGHVNTTAYLLLLRAANSGLPSDWNAVPLAPGAVYKLTNPLAGKAFSIEGGDSHSFSMPPAPAFASAESAADMVENYWMALLRDVPFANYSTHPLALQAIADLNNLSDYRGLKPVTPQNLFRGVESGCISGPMISQFLYLPCPFGATYIDQRITTYTAGLDFMTTFSEYLSIQNGQAPSVNQTKEVTPVFIRNGRDLGRWGECLLWVSCVYLLFMFCAHGRALSRILYGRIGPVGNACSAEIVASISRTYKQCAVWHVWKPIHHAAISEQRRFCIESCLVFKVVC